MSYVIVRIIVATVFICTNQALAKGSKSKSDETPKGSTSRDFRAGKQWLLIGEAGGALPFGVTYGLIGGFFMDDDLIIEINAVTSKEHTTLSNTNASYVGGRLKKIWGNTFYTNTGAGIRAISTNIRYHNNEDYSLNRDATYKGTNSTLVLDYAIGNNWQMEAMTFGVDWIGVFIPILTISKHDKYSNPNQEDTIAVDAYKQHSRKMSIQLMRLNMGVSF